MNRSYVFVMVAAMSMVVGCSHNVSNVSDPTVARQEKPKAEKKPAMSPDEEQEGFMKYCQGVHEGSKYVWNKTTQAWEWATSEETKNTATGYYNSAKDNAVKAYDAAKRAYDAAANDVSKK